MTTGLDSGAAHQNLSPPTARPIGVRRSRTIGALLEAATDAFAEGGFHGASIEDICQRADLTSGAFYSNYPDKYELLHAVLRERVDWAVEQQMAAVEHQLMTATEPISERAYLLMCGDLSHDARPMRRYISIFKQSRLLAIREPHTAARIAATTHAMSQAVATALTRMLERSGRVPLIEVEELAQVTLTLWQELYFQRYDVSGADTGDRLFERVTPRVVQMLSCPKADAPVHSPRLHGAGSAYEAGSRSGEDRQSTPIEPKTDHSGRSNRKRAIRSRRNTAAMLVTAAEDAFVERGFHGTSITDICTRGGLTTGAYYSNFDTKADLLAAAVNSRLDRSMEIWADTVKAARDAPEPPIAGWFPGYQVLAEVRAANLERYVLLRFELDVLAAHDAHAMRALEQHQVRHHEKFAHMITTMVSMSGLALTMEMSDAVRLITALQNLRVRHGHFSGLYDRTIAPLFHLIAG